MFLFFLLVCFSVSFRPPRDPSCVHTHVSGTTLYRKDGSLYSAFNGRSSKIPPVDPKRCSNYKNPSNAWEAYTQFENTKNISSFISTFNVPAAPTTSSQVLYLFPGMQDFHDNDVLEIIQPVLEYNYEEKRWKLACWYVTGSGQYEKSEYIYVNEKDDIIGNMTKTGDDSYYIGAYLKSDPTQKTEITVKKTPLITQPWAFLTVELWGADKPCTVFPMSDYYFYDVVLKDETGEIKPVWTKEVSTDCVPEIDITEERVTFKFKMSK